MCVFSFADNNGLVMKSTRNTDNYNLIDGITPSTILVHGLLGEVCISDSDCSIVNSICDKPSKRCACKPGTVPDALEKMCKPVGREVPPTVLISKWPTQCVNLIIFLLCQTTKMVELATLTYIRNQGYYYVFASLETEREKTILQLFEFICMSDYFWKSVCRNTAAMLPLLLLASLGDIAKKIGINSSRNCIFQSQ